MLTLDQLFVGGTYWCDLGDGEGDKPIVITSITSGHIMIGIDVITDDGKYRATINRDWLMRYGSMRVIDIDPCEGVVCEDMCDVYDLWSQMCVDGICVKDAIVESNSPTCGYTGVSEPNIFDVIMDNKEIVILGAIVGSIALKSR